MSNKKTRQKTGTQKGFSLIEAVVAIFILTIGLMGAAAALTYALEYGMTSHNVGNAKLLITSTIEEIESLRNTKRLEFKQIANVGAVDNTDCRNDFSGFSTGFQPIALAPGFDGVNGTADDIKIAGPDAVLGTADDIEDTSLIRSGYTRKITITPLAADPTIKKVEVIIRYYSAGGKVSQIAGVGYINNESRTTG
jgi:prepilin-type N-terminal cleavage/methylation domain-containing protein